jgi:nitrate/nitrite transporter NarK
VGFVPAFALYGACQSAGVLFAMKHIGDRVGESVQGKAFGLAAALGDVGMVIMPSVLLPLFAWRHEALFLALGAAMWLFGAAFVLLEPASRREKIASQPPAA